MFVTSAFAKAIDGAGQSESVFPPFDTSTFAGQIFWLVVTFGLLFWLMSKVALPRISDILEQRKDRIEGDLAQASRMQGDADEAAAAYEKTLADARNGAQATAKDMRDKISADSDAQRSRLESELNARLADAEARIAATKADAMKNVSSIAEDVTGNIVEQLTGKRPDADAVKSIVASLKIN